MDSVRGGDVKARMAAASWITRSSSRRRRATSSNGEEAEESSSILSGWEKESDEGSYTQPCISSHAQRISKAASEETSSEDATRD